MLGWFLNVCYALAAALWLPVLLWKRFRTGKYRQGWSQKLLGRVAVTPRSSRPRVWLHAVSVGEVLQLRPLVDRLKQAIPQLDIVVSTTTETGHAVARDKLAECQVIYYPLDFTGSVRAALQRVQPDLIVFVELELWPNFILEAARRNIPLALVNGRLSARSFRGYCRLRPLLKKLLNCFAIIAAQTEEYRERFLALGADPARTVTTGSIKFDGVQTDRHLPGTRQLREWLALDESNPVFVAGSTQAPEEQMAVDVWQSLLTEFPNLQLILVPRHPERGEDVVRLIENSGCRARRRSCRQETVQKPDVRIVGLLDTVGELGACWGLADVAFVGGSFTDRGGQNMLEPAAFGTAVCFGPNTWNFKQAVELLLAREAARTVHSQEELREFVREMLLDRQIALRMGSRARELILSQQGATDRTIQLLLTCLPGQEGCSVRSRAA